MEKAVDTLQAAIHSDSRNPAQALAYPVLAMAYHRAGQSDEARTTLAEAEKAFDRWLDAFREASVGSSPVLWFDFIEYRLLYREAVELVTGSALSEDPRLAAIEQRALEAIEMQ
jgi:hypothetical protein